jgi:hypothetical protein
MPDAARAVVKTAPELNQEEEPSPHFAIVFSLSLPQRRARLTLCACVLEGLWAALGVTEMSKRDQRSILICCLSMGSSLCDERKDAPGHAAASLAFPNPRKKNAEPQRQIN